MDTYLSEDEDSSENENTPLSLQTLVRVALEKLLFEVIESGDLENLQQICQVYQLGVSDENLPNLDSEGMINLFTCWLMFKI
jgi:hypothetical protein